MSGFNEPSSGRYIVAIGGIALRAVTETSISSWLAQLPAGERKTAVQRLCAMCASSVGHAFDAEEVWGDVTS